MSDSSSDNAGVRFPPPLIYVAGIALGALLHRFSPLPIPGVPPALGLGFIAAGLILMFLGFREFRRFATSVRPDQPATAILRTGPFRYSRNPLYIALGSIYLGVAVWMNNLWAVAMLAPVLLLVRYLVIGREERYLERRFGEDYRSYQRSVRRWL